MSFSCDHCHFANNEIQPAGEIQERGSQYIFRPECLDDMQRQVVKSDSAILRIEDLDLEVPPGRGRLTDVEGVLSAILKDLEAGQKTRKKENPELYHQLDVIVQDLVKILIGSKFPCTISLDDPAGNSWIEPSSTDSSKKGKYAHKQYPRSQEQNAALGLGEATATEPEELTTAQIQAENGGGMEGVDILEGKVYKLDVLCPGCTKPTLMLTQMVNIPYFKQVILMSTNCSECGYRSSEAKTGGKVPEKGKRIWLDVRSPKDLRRDILKSETCMLKVPECRVEIEPGTMGGRFTTVEGLLTQVRDDLKSTVFDVGDDEAVSDSMPNEKKTNWKTFFSQLDKAIAGELQFTIEMEDPLANSYCQNFDIPGPGLDPQIRTEEYERTEEEEHYLGLADMKTKLNEDGEYVRDVPDKSAGQLERSTEVSNGIP